MPVQLSGKDIVKALGKGGWELEQVTGSHHVMRHADGRHVSVPCMGPGRSRPGRSQRSADRSAAPQASCVTFFRMPERPVSLSLALRAVVIHTSGLRRLAHGGL